MVNSRVVVALLWLRGIERRRWAAVSSTSPDRSATNKWGIRVLWCGVITKVLIISWSSGMFTTILINRWVRVTAAAAAVLLVEHIWFCCLRLCCVVLCCFVLLLCCFVLLLCWFVLFCAACAVLCCFVLPAQSNTRVAQSKTSFLLFEKSAMTYEKSLKITLITYLYVL